MDSTNSATWTRFSHGLLTCTVVSDGPLLLGPARECFPNSSPEVVDETLTRLDLPTDCVVLEQNILAVEADGQLVLFDTGVGAMPDLGRKIYGPQSGKMLENLAAAGIDPAEVDIVALTHAHPDHAWGLLDVNGKKAFPNAKIIVGDADFTHFTDPSNADNAPNPRVRNQFIGAAINLLPYGDRVVRIGDGYSVAKGITAIATPGHSPGHLIFEIVSDDSTLVVWGDLCHHPLLLEQPLWNFVFDGDKSAAAEQRIRVFDRVLANGARVLSYHFPFPGLGTLRQEGSRYAWEQTRPDKPA